MSTQKLTQSMFIKAQRGNNSSVHKKKNINNARCWWLTPVILPTQEAEIRRIAVQSQSRPMVFETLS
jgi:hypothetical protein